MCLLAKAQTGKVKPDTNLNLLFFFLFHFSFSFPSILSLTCQNYVKDLIKMSDHIYFLLFSISQILSSLSHVHLFSPHFRSTISLYFVLYFFSPHLNSLSSFIGSQFYFFTHLHLSQASYQLPIFFHAFSLTSLFFKFFFFFSSSVLILGWYTHFARHTEILLGTPVQAGTGRYLE